MEREVDELKQEIKELKRQIKEYEELINEISVPVIPSIIPETILVPVTGKLSPDRLELIFTKISETAYRLSYNEGLNTVIIDFTAISQKELGEIDTLGMYIENVQKALNLMGVDVLFVGFTPAVTQDLIQSGLSIVDNLNTFLSFRAALRHLMKKRGLTFEQIR
ncbi:STAS domain-containing protein [Bacillus badius]|uniref:RsbR, positive regulator of sigma-B n=1 Tax=Bacillus badius TaxID=1455 RepID=A0ABR5AQH4_BACBA|nr:STAS domain-containing protein [Bacillus badius]KIL72244.1 RsbR, positive regulator of sigma-B [Bacillus badius]KIL77008.1 RsbR, positive regulator of sigma-B [Bacillus badius]MED4718047.1 STAS domain-containing protein [Bacillus badius]